MRRPKKYIAPFKAETQSGNILRFEQCKGGYFSDKEEYGLKVVGKTAQDGTPTPETPVEIQCVKADTKIRSYGKNFFKYSLYYVPNTLICTDNNDGTITFNGTMTKQRIVIADFTDKFLNNKNVTVKMTVLSGSINNEYSGTGFSYRFIMVRDSGSSVNGAKIGYENNANITNLEFKAKFTLGTKNNQIWLQTGGIMTFDNAVISVQLEIGDEYTDWKPYIEPQEITTPCDLYEGDIWYPMSGKIIRNNGIKIFDGTEDISAFTEPKRYLYTIPDMLEKMSSLTATDNIYSNIFKRNSFYNIGSNAIAESGISLSSLHRICFSFGKNSPLSEMDKTEIKNYLKTLYDNGKPMYIVYPLETQIIEQYNSQPIFAPQGTVNVLQEPIGLPAELSVTMLVRR